MVHHLHVVPDLKICRPNISDLPASEVGAKQEGRGELFDRGESGTTGCTGASHQWSLPPGALGKAFRGLGRIVFFTKP